MLKMLESGSGLNIEIQNPTKIELFCPDLLTTNIIKSEISILKEKRKIAERLYIYIFSLVNSEPGSGFSCRSDPDPGQLHPDPYSSKKVLMRKTMVYRKQVYKFQRINHDTYIYNV